VLLDECVDARLAADIAGHEVTTSPAVGWAGITNGELLSRAERQFDVLVTVDRRLPFQQNLSRFPIAVVILRARSTRLEELRRLLPDLLVALRNAKPGEVTWVGAEQGS
jgi:hypothetical protein